MRTAESKTRCLASYVMRIAESKQKTGGLLNEQLSAILISHVTCIMFYNLQIFCLCISGVSVLEEHYKPDATIRH